MPRCPHKSQESAAIQDVNDIVILMSAPGITFVQGQFFLNHSTCPKNPYKERKKHLSQKTRKEKQGMDEKIRVQVVVSSSENCTHQH